MSNSTATLSLADATKTWNPDLLKAFAANKQTRAVLKALDRARTYAIVTRVLVNGYVAPIFATYEFYNDLEASRRGLDRARITEEKNLYLSEDKAGCERFYAECFAAARANGYDVVDGQCPALVAENGVTKLENALLTWASTFFGFDFKKCHGALRERAIALFARR